MESILLLSKLVIAVSIVIVWVFRFDNIEKEFKQYGLSVSDYKRRNLLKTDVSSSDVAELVAFLASTKSSKTTGTQVPIDGGNDRVI